MSAPNLSMIITNTLAAFLEETFTNVQGIYLEAGTSLFETLDGISAEEASRPVSDRCASIAGQTEHLRFYIEIMTRYVLGEKVEGVDWNGSWSVTTVTPAEWDALRNRLKAEYEQTRMLVLATSDWTAHDGDIFGESLTIAIHTAYHLGEIRQACCTVKR